MIKLTQVALSKFCQTLEEHIQKEITEAYPMHWEEDYITRRVLVAFTRLSNSQVEISNTFNNIFIKPFKLKGTPEYKYGDIAIIMDIEFKDADKLVGVAFLEAKKMFANNQYSSLKIDQLERLYGNAPNGRLLLYNYPQITPLAPTGLDTNTRKSTVMPMGAVTYSSVTNLNTAVALDTKNDKLHKVSIPLSYQFTFRYLFGMDLEFKEDAIKAARGYLESIGSPNFVIAISIKQGKKDELDIENWSYSPDINRQRYDEIVDENNQK